jgi:hypothetical protein
MLSEKRKRKRKMWSKKRYLKRHKGRYDLMYLKTKELGWKETQGIQNIGIEDSQGNRIVSQSQVLKIGRIIL